MFDNSFNSQPLPQIIFLFVCHDLQNFSQHPFVLFLSFDSFFLYLDDKVIDFVTVFRDEIMESIN